MKRTGILTILILICALLLSACGCEHSAAVPGDCVTDTLCADCGKILEPAPGHSWQEATLEAPKTCTLCGATEGKRLSSQILFSAEAAAPLLGRWETPMSIPASQLGSGLDTYLEELPCVMVLSFTENGDLTMSVTPADHDQMAQLLYDYTIDSIYAQYEGLDMTREEAEADILNTYGMPLADYVQAAVDAMDISAIFADYAVSYVYYVDGNQLYLGFDWYEPLFPGEFTLEQDVLTLPFQGGEPTTFTRVTE